MPTIDQTQPLVTLITVHECTPENQAALVDLLLEAARSIYAGAPGFISATIHRSFDGTCVTNYAQYKSREAFEALTKNPAIPPFVERVRKLVTTAKPHLYEVVAWSKTKDKMQGTNRPRLARLRRPFLAGMPSGPTSREGYPAPHQCRSRRY